MHLLPRHEHRFQLCLCQRQHLQFWKTCLHPLETQQHLLHLSLLHGPDSCCSSGINIHPLPLFSDRLLPLQPHQHRLGFLQIPPSSVALCLHEFFLRPVPFNSIFRCRSGDGSGSSSHHSLLAGGRVFRAPWNSALDILPLRVSINVQIWFWRNDLCPILE